MKNQTLFILPLLALSAVAQANSYKLDAAHTTVEFKVNHLVLSQTSGRFNQFEGTFDLDEKAKKIENLQVKIQAGSIDTNEKDRDAHLKGKDFFDIEKFPTLEFQIKSATYKEGKPSTLKGELTIHGVTQPVTLTLDYKGKQKDPWGNQHAIFSATTQINRKDFGLTWNKKLDAGGLLIGEEIKISINGEALENKAQ